MFTTLQIRCKNGCVYVKENEDATQYCFEASTGGKTSCKGVDGASCTTSSEQQGLLLFHSLWFLIWRVCFEPHIYVLDVFEIVKVIIVYRFLLGKLWWISKKGGWNMQAQQEFVDDWCWKKMGWDFLLLFTAEQLCFNGIQLKNMY